MDQISSTEESMEKNLILRRIARSGDSKMNFNNKRWNRRSNKYFLNICSGLIRFWLVSKAMNDRSKWIVVTKKNENSFRLGFLSLFLFAFLSCFFVRKMSSSVFIVMMMIRQNRIKTKELEESNSKLNRNNSRRNQNKTSWIISLWSNEDLVLSKSVGFEKKQNKQRCPPNKSGKAAAKKSKRKRINGPVSSISSVETDFGEKISVELLRFDKSISSSFSVHQEKKRWPRNGKYSKIGRKNTIRDWSMNIVE